MVAALELQAGSSRIFIDVDVNSPGEGTNQKVSADMTTHSFEKIAAAIKDIAHTLESQLALLEQPPSEVALNLGAKITGGAELWIVKSGAEAQLQIGLKWTR